MRAIDADALKVDYLFPTTTTGTKCYRYVSMEQIQNAPTISPEPHWIPVAERLPKKERNMYWVCTDTECQCECRWTNNIYGIGESDHWGWSIFDIPQYSHVTAWMPLPEPWKGEQDG